MESKNSMGAIIGVLAVVALVIGGVVLFTQDDDSETTTTESSQQETSTPVEEAPVAEVEEQTIVELAQGTADLSILVSAVVEAELVDTLSSEGPFTVFAPTNDAFAALLEDLDITAEELLAREDLADILTYHVVSGEVLSSDLSDGQVVETVNGETLTVSIEDGVVRVNDSVVTAVDIDASNGVVHLIDSVLLPGSN